MVLTRCRCHSACTGGASEGWPLVPETWVPVWALGIGQGSAGPWALSLWERDLVTHAHTHRGGEGEKERELREALKDNTQTCQEFSVGEIPEHMETHKQRNIHTLSNVCACARVCVCVCVCEEKEPILMSFTCVFQPLWQVAGKTLHRPC